MRFLVSGKDKGLTKKKEIRWPRAIGKIGNPSFYLAHTNTDDADDYYDEEYEEETNIKIIDGVNADGTPILKSLTPANIEESDE